MTRPSAGLIPAFGLNGQIRYFSDVARTPFNVPLPNAFTTFLFGRMIGCAVEMEDHINRGRNMDARTPASQCGFVG